MSLNNIKFIKGKGGLGRPLAGKDYISGLLFYTANGNLPTGFSTTNRVQQIFSVQDAESLGIKADYNDETQATGVYTISAAGATGDKISLQFTEPNSIINLGSYVKLATDTTPTMVATGLVNAINANTYIHGYSASNTAGAITVSVRKGLGVYPNTGTPLSDVVAGTIVGSVTTAFAGGVASLQSVWHYHIAEFFRVQPKGFLWIGFFAVPGTYTYTEIQNMQNIASGEIRQIGIFVDSKAYSVADLSTVQGICNTLDELKMPLSVIYAGNIVSFPTITNLADLATLSNNKVSVVIGQDASGLGSQIFSATGKSVTTLGATLGAVALASVHEDIAWVGKFNLSDGTELESLAFANGVKFSDVSISATLLDAVDLKRYIFLRKFPNVAGSYFNDDHTAISPNSDYAFISNNRTIDKAIRGVYASLIPSLNSPLLLNSDGTLANSTIAYLESQAVVNTDQMVRNGEVSAVGVTINPNQNVASTSIVEVSITLVPIGVARNIIVNIGFKTTL